MRISDWSSDVCSSDLIAGGIEADLLPLQVHHRRGDDDAALARPCRRQKVEDDVDALRARGHIDVEGVNIGRLTRPDERLAARRRLESRHLGERAARGVLRSEEQTSELQSLMRNSYAVFCLKKKKS